MRAPRPLILSVTLGFVLVGTLPGTLSAATSSPDSTPLPLRSNAIRDPRRFEDIGVFVEKTLSELSVDPAGLKPTYEHSAIALKQLCMESSGDVCNEQLRRLEQIYARMSEDQARRKRVFDRLSVPQPKLTPTEILAFTDPDSSLPQGIRALPLAKIQLSAFRQSRKTEFLDSAQELFRKALRQEPSSPLTVLNDGIKEFEALCKESPSFSCLNNLQILYLATSDQYGLPESERNLNAKRVSELSVLLQEAPWRKAQALAEDLLKRAGKAESKTEWEKIGQQLQNALDQGFTPGSETAMYMYEEYYRTGVKKGFAQPRKF